MTWRTFVRGGSLVGVALLLAVAPPPAATEDRQVVRVTAERFAFSPSQIKVKRGTVVEFRLRSEDTNHGFHILHGANVIIPKRGRGEATVIFRADTPGRYTFECSKMCGAGHSFMRGLITVDE
jgi:cytochrome c oxidase subunit II